MSPPATPRPRRKSAALRGKPCADLAGQDEPHAQRYYHLLILLCMDSAGRSAVFATPRVTLAQTARARKYRQAWILRKARIRRGKLAHNKHRSPLRLDAPRMHAI